MVFTDKMTVAATEIQPNKLPLSDQAFHNWYQFILSFPPHLVQNYIQKLDLPKHAVILDPFCGTGTTLVEAKKHHFSAIGIEAIPMACLASKVKTTWNIEAEQVRQLAELLCYHAEQLDQAATERRTFNDEQYAVILNNSICEQPLHQCLLLIEVINQVSNIKIRQLFRLALAYVTVYSASNLRFAPEVSIRRQKRHEVNVFQVWHEKVLDMADDLEQVQDQTFAPTRCCLSDARHLSQILPPRSVDVVITSPPYPNEKDYTRATRLESVLLGFLGNKADLRRFKQNLVRSNTRNVYSADDDDCLLSANSAVLKIADEIERRRISQQKTSGFARLYPRAAKLYFGGMKRHLAELRPALKPGAKLAYVVGDQASYLQVLIQTGELLAEIATELGYTVQDMELFRTRTSSVTGERLKEEVLLLKWQ